MIQKLYDKHNDPDVLQHIVDILNDGGIIIYPTDTMYAMGCHALKERPIEKICRLKNLNPKKNNLSIICYDLSNISEYAQVGNATFKLMKRNLPGPFTFILKADSRLPKIFRNRKEVGIRVPDNTIIREICRLLEAPSSYCRTCVLSATWNSTPCLASARVRFEMPHPSSYSLGRLSAHR